MSNPFLETIWPTDRSNFAELRMIRNGQVKQHFYGIEANWLSELMLRATTEDAEGWDCYIGAMPRVRASGKAEDCTPTTTLLWADLDNKNIGSHVASLLSLQASGLEPSILVDSGNGLHSYWLMREPIPFGKAQEAMKGLHKLIGSDPVHDAPRVLRLPGTNNHKGCGHYGETMTPGEAAESGNLLYEPDFDACKPVRLLKLDPMRRYRWADFAEFVAPPPATPPRVTGYEAGRQEYHQLPDWLREHIEKGAPEGQRSELIWKVVCNLLERGWDEEEISALFMAMPIGEKVQDMTEKEAERYMRRTIERAAEVVL